MSRQHEIRDDNQDNIYDGFLSSHGRKEMLVILLSYTFLVFHLYDTWQKITQIRNSSPDVLQTGKE